MLTSITIYIDVFIVTFILENLFDIILHYNLFVYSVCLQLYMYNNSKQQF